MPTLPPLAEQAAIVRFLDHADRRIRRYIRAKRKLIELLKEQKQAIIHRAVTRGLDPNVRLKPSGIPWLGDMPEHWEVRRAEAIVFDESSTVHDSPTVLDEAMPYPARQLDVKRWIVRLDDARRLGCTQSDCER